MAEWPKRHVIESHADLVIDRFADLNLGATFQLRCARLLDRRGEFNGGGPMVNPSALWVLRRLRVRITIVLRKAVGGKEVYCEKGHEQDMMYSDKVAAIGQKSSRSQTTRVDYFPVCQANRASVRL